MADYRNFRDMTDPADAAIASAMLASGRVTARNDAAQSFTARLPGGKLVGVRAFLAREQPEMQRARLLAQLAADCRLHGWDVTNGA